MATFGGERIFGTAISIDQIETLLSWQVTGILYGDTVGQLADNEQRLRDFMDDNPRTLVDTAGVVREDVVLSSYQPTGRVRQSPGGVFFRPYKAAITHRVTA